MADADTLRQTALALLNSGARLSVKAGSFLGGIVADPRPLTEAQATWLDQLVDRAGLPPIREGHQ